MSLHSTSLLYVSTLRFYCTSLLYVSTVRLHCTSLLYVLIEIRFDTTHYGALQSRACLHILWLPKPREMGLSHLPHADDQRNRSCGLVPPILVRLTRIYSFLIFNQFCQLQFHYFHLNILLCYTEIVGRLSWAISGYSGRHSPQGRLVTLISDVGSE